MGRNKCMKWISRVVGVIASLSALCICGNDGYITEQSLADVETVEFVDHHDEFGQGNVIPPPANTNSCSTVKDKLLMFISTLDGRVSVLDVNKDGNLLWSVQADARPLLSSSIGKLELNKDGMRTRLIPSLDGGLYQYDGDSIKAVPITAEKLLGSSYRLDDKTMIIGGKDTKSYGIDAVSGQVRYVCSVEGCKFLGDGEVTDDEDIIVIKRSTQTVRAVESKTGTERWNFSVGHHELEFVDATLPITDADDYEDDDGIKIKRCLYPDNTDDVSDETLKILVPDGMIVALSPEDDGHVLWQHKFSSPVTNAWLLKKGVMKRLSLFDDHHVPALSSFQAEGIEGLPREPLLYVGMHQNQLYVQPSAVLREDMMNAPGSNFIPQIAWRPYLTSAPSRTPILSGNRNKVPLLGEKSTDRKKDDKSLVVWHENYPFDNGYYLYPDTTRLLPVHNLTPTDSDILYIPASLHYWWKEVIAISLITSVILHMILTKLVKKEIPPTGSQSSGEKDNVITRSDSENSEPVTEFASRFTTEFDFVQCLGKGGFGVVFEAKNKMDECNYAVKRISLSNGTGAKERVMREVRALAKLDNSGIVRYFNAWMENPPSNWIDSIESHIEDSECLTPTPCNSATDLKIPFFNSGLNSNDWNLKCGDSESFEVNKMVESSTDESGSYSIGTVDQPKLGYNTEDSFQIEFTETDSKCDKSDEKSSSISDNSQTTFLPSTHKSAQSDDNSFSVVFEDSGCKDRSSNESNNQSVMFDNDYSEDMTSYNNNNNKSGQLEKVVVDQQTCKTQGSLYLYIQMQLCRRETLKDWLCANTLNRDRRTVLDIFDQIVEAVDYVHGCGLMHRDLKPTNIFFSMDGAIKIGDFGLVTGLEKQNDSIMPSTEDQDIKHTAEVGTQLYMSPEQVSRNSYDHKVDIFSMGMILFELFYPFSTQMERIRTLVDLKKLIFPARFSKEMPQENKFVKWLLALNPVDRPSTTQILDSDLLKEFAVRRTSSRFRSRTISGDSSSSTNNS